MSVVIGNCCFELADSHRLIFKFVQYWMDLPNYIPTQLIFSDDVTLVLFQLHLLDGTEHTA